ncbi:MAG TPA: DUF6340 family protein [Bacteroidia bacterium]|jgi:hypothetical protein
MKRTFTLLLLAALFFPSCTAYVHFDAIQPAYVNIPVQYKKILLINRTRPDAKRSIDKLENVLTGEWGKQDSKASFRCLDGLSQNLQSSLKNYQTMVLKDTNLAGTGNMIFPPAMPPRFIDSVCAKYGADIAIVLEAFDTDVISKANGAPVLLSPLPLLNPLAGPTFTLFSRVKAGFRIYDPKNNDMIDQFTLSTNYDFARMNIPDQEVLLHLPHALQGVYENGFMCGNDYGYRVAPHMASRTREIYRKGNYQLKMAYRSAVVGKWDDAYAIWQKNITCGKRRAEWHSYYDLAVYYEKTGNLNLAIETAEKGFQLYGRRPLLYYSNILKDMKVEEKRVVEQLPDTLK